MEVSVRADMYRKCFCKQLLPFYLFRFDNRYYANCTLDELSFQYTERNGKSIQYRMSITAHDPTLYTATANWMGAGKYEDMVSSSLSGGTHTVPVQDFQSPVILFAGAARVTGTSEDLIYIPYGPASSTLHVITLNIIGCSGVTPGASGTTTVKVWDQPVGGSGGTAITASITQAQSTPSAPSTGDISIVTDANGKGAPIYFSMSVAAGGHTDVQAYCVIRTA